MMVGKARVRQRREAPPERAGARSRRLGSDSEPSRGERCGRLFAMSRAFLLLSDL
jgi:hypothetical protein